MRPTTFSAKPSSVSLLATGSAKSTVSVLISSSAPGISGITEIGLDLVSCSDSAVLGSRCRSRTFGGLVRSPPPGAILIEGLLVLEFLEFLEFLECLLLLLLLLSQLTREPMVVTVSLRPGALSEAGLVSSRRRTTSIAFSSSTILGCLVILMLVDCHA